MIRFDLSGAHADYRRVIPEIIDPLVAVYPGAVLKTVTLYDPKYGDTSMAATTLGGHIRLNAHWFAREPEFLQDAARNCPVIEVGGVSIGWHGPMIREPEHVLTHEFGHVVWYALPREVVRKWSGDRWAEATRNPHKAPSGYAMVRAMPDGDEGAEFFGEMFTLVHLGLATDDEARDMGELTERLR